MKRDALFRVVLGYIVAITALTFLTYHFAFGEIKSHYTVSAEKNMEAQAVILKAETFRLLKAGKINELKELIKKASSGSGTRFTVIDSSGKVLADSEHDPETMENHKDRPEIAAALSGKKGVSVRYSSTIKDNMIYVALPPAGKKPGESTVVRASVHLKEISALIKKLGARISLIALLALLAGIVAAFLYDLFEVSRLEKIKRDFVANVSHELRTPLTAIKGYAETLEMETKNPESKRYVEIIIKNTERLINIVTDLLTLSRLEEKQKIMTFEDVNLGDAIRNAAKIFEQQAAAKKLSITLEIPERLPVVWGDALKLEQVFVNLIDNAIKYTENGGVIIKAANDNSAIKVDVSDTGIGIPHEHIERIFERFYVVDKSRSRKAGGTGLGLAIVKHIMKLHYGTVMVESKPGAGTKFTLYFKAKSA